MLFSFCVTIHCKEADSRTLKRACANLQIFLRAAKLVELEKVNWPKLGQHFEIAWWNWLTCFVGPQSGESLDCGPSTLNGSEGILGIRFATQLKGYPNFDLVTFLYGGGWRTQGKNDQHHARRWNGSDERDSGGGEGVECYQLQSSFWIHARQLVVSEVAIVFKTIGLSFLFDGIDQHAWNFRTAEKDIKVSSKLLAE